ncbi:patatin-like phospholipase family protein [Bradyrhizobium sp. WSM1417]|uniref:patatin-like phospholipase family protein n=1 Tax=Bradyrhizobium sp. WSM1417 TaxID=754500 RepID=UPI0004BB80AD|nr:patatin-like phospholipase family protein [Bradyrhizobium sp. WSM1417]
MSAGRMLAQERERLCSSRERVPESPWLGLALSGGGVRSATYCLGAVQRLAAAGLLKHFDYMSSVSGGGYTAASLQWFWTRMPELDSGSQFPYGTARSAPVASDNENLVYLRTHSSFLAPGQGISIWSGVAVVIRTLLLSLLVWFPVTIGAMLLIMVVAPSPAILPWEWIFLPSPQFKYVQVPLLGVTIPSFAGWALVGMFIVAAIFLAFTSLLALASILVPPETIDNIEDRKRRARKCILVGIVPGGAGLLVSQAISEYGPGLPYFSSALLWLGFALTGFGLLAIVVALLQSMRRLEFGLHYTLRRDFDLGTTCAAWSFAGFALLCSIPFASQYALRFMDEQPSLFAALTAASGLVSGLYGHFVQAQRAAPRLAFRWGATLLAGAFLYMMLVLAFLVVDLILGNDHGHPLLAHNLAIAFPITLFFSVAFGLSSNLNHLGLHRFYRDRLMEAFLATKGNTGFSAADRSLLADYWVAPQDASRVLYPYPLINTNAIMINDDNPVLRLRGGDSFVLSPMFLGSASTGWMETRKHIERYGPLTLASAMAASGAAANANAAYIGSGITRDRLISIVMVLLNVRLGVWLGRPGARPGTPNYFNAGFKYGIWGAYRSNSNFVELTDGGHFDNLGVYELIRRRLDVIVVFDSEEDPATSMSALASVCQRVHEDFGVTIDVGDKADSIVAAKDMGYPPQAKFSEQTWFLCKIIYPEPASYEGPNGELLKGIGRDLSAKEGLFLYVKSNMQKELSFPAKGYKAKNPDFPNQSTMDQFFEPAQFEAYRELGFATVDTVIRKLTADGSSAQKFCADLLKAV